MIVERSAGGRTLRLEVVPETADVELSQTMLGVRIPPPLTLDDGELRWLAIIGAPQAYRLSQLRRSQLEREAR